MQGGIFMNDPVSARNKIYRLTLDAMLIALYVILSTFLSIKIPGFISGRGSYKAVSSQIYTKFRRGLIKGITGKTFGKLWALDLYYGIGDAVLSEGIEQ